ncbi:hypothetical protein LTR46_004281 [Exophiala xenobiotica]|nr:hypothetical protein LTR46_004281 [Exophiala xenobiotica]
MADDRGLVFVNYNDPATQAGKREYRRIISSHIGKHYRNSPKPLQKSGIDRVRQRQHQGVPAASASYHGTPLSGITMIPFKINSDPFDSYCGVVEIDPQINSILAFYRDSAIAGMSAVSRRGWTFWQISAVSTRDAFDVLNDPHTARGFLERAANMGSLVMPSLRGRALAFLGDTLGSLMRDLHINAVHGHVAEPRTQSRPVAIYRQIMVLFSCATLVGDWGAAHPHGVMLRSMIQAQSPLGKVDFGMLHHVLFMDAHYAANFLVQPLFDMEHWYREEFELGCPSPLPVPGISEWPDRHEGNGDWSWNVNLLGPIDAESSLHDIRLVTRSVLRV